MPGWFIQELQIISTACLPLSMLYLFVMLENISPPDLLKTDNIIIMVELNINIF